MTQHAGKGPHTECGCQPVDSTMVATMAPLGRRRSRGNSFEFQPEPMPRPFSPFGDVDLASNYT